MGNLQELTNAFALQNTQVSLIDVVINLVLAAILTQILAYIYIKHGQALSNRRAFARNFILMAMITALIITIVKSSLALSLGLVGALSIVRYRTAIKDPEELAYLFFTIAIGLGLGADMRLVTIVAFFIIVFIIWFSSFVSSKKQSQENLYLTIASSGGKKWNINNIISSLESNCSSIDLKRLDESADDIEMSFLVEFDNIKKLTKAKEDLQKICPSLKISFLDNKGIIM